MTTHAPTQEELRGTAQALGVKLGTLIAALDLADDVKEAFMALLPELSIEQIDMLLEVLESAALHQQTASIDVTFRAELERIKVAHAPRQAQLEAKASAELDALVSKLAAKP